MEFSTPTAGDMHALLGLAAVLMLAVAVDLRFAPRARGILVAAALAVLIDACTIALILGALSTGAGFPAIWLLSISAVFITTCVLVTTLAARIFDSWAADSK